VRGPGLLSLISLISPGCFSLAPISSRERDTDIEKKEKKREINPKTHAFRNFRLKLSSIANAKEVEESEGRVSYSSPCAFLYSA
jgi:hypothetical protein